MLYLVFSCGTCWHTNIVERGQPGFVELECEFDSLSGAWQHLCAHPHHHMENEIRETGEDD